LTSRQAFREEEFEGIVSQKAFCEERRFLHSVSVILNLLRQGMGDVLSRHDHVSVYTLNHSVVSAESDNLVSGYSVQSFAQRALKRRNPFLMIVYTLRA
jgi:hypothetical protein